MTKKEQKKGFKVALESGKTVIVPFDPIYCTSIHQAREKVAMLGINVKWPLKGGANEL